MTAAVPTLAVRLAGWAAHLVPARTDLELATRSLRDTVAVTVAARGDDICRLVADGPPALRWAAAGHVLDFDDLHPPSTTHISVVCVPAVLACGGDARCYLAAAGVMARLGTALGWPHYSRGWHATCTAGAPAAAVGAGLALGLDEPALARALALAVPAAGGVQRAFGTSAKALQVGFAADAGVRAARLVAAGASADPAAFDQWFALMGGDAARVDLDGPAVPGGLAVKLFPCCYAAQRPISAVRQLRERPLEAAEVARIVVRTPAATVHPLTHPRPVTGIEGKFSLEYALAAALLDDYPGLSSFTDEAVGRAAARQLVERVETHLAPGGSGLLAGEIELELVLTDGTVRRTATALPPGSPDRPPTADQLHRKIKDCAGDRHPQLTALTWPEAAGLLHEALSGHPVRPAS
ncbi:MAG TPA: MmgE/PrpD family protein [Micromonosporaceae bacterium]|nr:MmgE/PrpD family protein [Micromonosporaceae bacterium]